MTATNHMQDMEVVWNLLHYGIEVPDYIEKLYENDIDGALRPYLQAIA